MAVGARHYGDIRASRRRLARPGRDRARPDRRPADGPSPAACSSACRSPATWSPIRAWSSWTSRPAASTSRCRRGCSTCCAAWSRELGLAAVARHARSRASRACSAHRLMVMQAGAVGRDRPDRPGARRSAARPTPSSSSPRSCRYDDARPAARASPASARPSPA